MNTASSLNGVASSLLPARVAAKITIGSNDIHPVLSLNIQQTYGDHHRFYLRCYADSIQSAHTPTIADATAQLLGRTAEIELANMYLPGTGAVLHARFIIVDLSLEESYMGQPVLCLTGYSPTWLLDDAPSYESFSNKTLADIARTCAKGLEKAHTGIKASPTLSTALPYLCRWRESNWNFLKRISAVSGQWLYFNGQDLIFGLPENKEAITLTYGHNCNKASLGMTTSSGAPAYNDYDASAHSPIQGKMIVATTEGGNYGAAGLASSRDLFGSAGGEAGRETISPPFFTADRKMLDAMVNADQGAHSSAYYTMRGESTAWQITVGSLLEVSFAMGTGQSPLGHPTMRVVSVEHRIDEGGTYTNKFYAVSNGAHPPALTYELPHTHSVLADVVSNADPMGQGRVQVKMLSWMQRHSQQLTDWIRVLTPDAGGTDAVMQNRGQMFIPEVGDQVLVDFVGGNPDRPYVVGSMYHGKNSRVQGGTKNNHLKSITTRSGHTIEFNDGLDQEKKEWGIVITDSAGNSIQLNTKDKKIYIFAPEELFLESKNIRLHATNDIYFNADHNINVEAKEVINIVADNNVVMGAKNDIQQTARKVKTQAQETVSIAGNDVKVGGKSNLELSANGKANLQSPYTVVSGSSNKLELP